MVVEHSFVTTLPQDQAMSAAANFLSDRGFISTKQSAFSMAPQTSAWETIEMRRGVASARRAKSVSELPHTIRIDFDRGRMTLAMSIVANHAWGGIGFLLSTPAGEPGNPKRMKLHQQLLTSIALGLERLLAGGLPPQQAAEDWDAAEAAIAVARRKRRRRNIILLCVFFLFIAAIIALPILASSRR